MTSEVPGLAGQVGARSARQRIILGSVWFTIPGGLAFLAAAYTFLPPLPGLEEPSARLALAARWLVVAMLPYAAVCLTIAGSRFFEGAHDPTAGGESTQLKIQCRVMQNTLEQLVWFAICLLAVASLVSAAEARIIPIVCVFFAIARLWYWWGYLRKGTLGRAPGVQLTFMLNVNMLLAVAVLAAR